MPELEICCDNYSSAQAACLGGADRIELCSAIGEGGLTPSFGMIKQVIKHLQIDVHVLIRPRGGDFLYSQDEIEIIKTDIKTCKELGVNGVVIGFLNADGSINKILTKEIIELSKPMKVTFHRAFDMSSNPYESLDDLIDIGVDYLLTSGQAPKAIDGVHLIRELVRKAGGKIKIMPGSGVRANNLESLYLSTNAPAFHISARIPTISEMKFRQEKVSMGSGSIDKEYLSHTHDVESIKMAKTILEKFSV